MQKLIQFSLIALALSACVPHRLVFEDFRTEEYEPKRVHQDDDFCRQLEREHGVYGDCMQSRGYHRR